MPERSKGTNLKQFLGLCALVITVVSLAACGLLPTPAPGSVLYQDDFSNRDSGWATWQGSGSYIFYDGGGLRFFVATPHMDFWSMANHQYDDASIEVDARSLDGPDNDDFGVICRYQNKDNFYALLVSGDGYYGIIKMKDGHYQVLSGDGKMKYDEAVPRGKQAIHLKAACVGTKLTLSVNGAKLAEAQDADFQSGDVGLMVGAYDEPNVDILFDNFKLTQP
jgi:nitrogen fixation-related uncharacterized protein